MVSYFQNDKRSARKNQASAQKCKNVTIKAYMYNQKLYSKIFNPKPDNS